MNLAKVAWAFATARIEAPMLFDSMALAARSLLGEFNPRSLANTAWAFACVDWKKDPEFFTELAYFAVTDLDASRGLSQLHLASLHFGLVWPDRCSPPSKLQQMLQMAYQLGWTPHVFEHATEEGLSLDMAQPDSKRAVEVDGPHHYLKRTRVENGPKSRLLRRLGWDDVVHVPLFDWATLDGEREEDSYLRAKLFANA
ncbi:hypothetical protein CTAYLR_003114 [Chrysophaeum taylorii]|uniref:RAP domain-containing protein n=1 Tax=Chrysophaeum taylorii TaxID=2483200 RepID=A0AAD7U7K8_9STRA|nr:hypothetical protein CTAYLR_003114 [Chrysophaeum taylorii]